MNKEQRQNTLQKTIRKADMQAQDDFDYGKIVFPREEFLQCSFEEGKEEITFTYNVTNYDCLLNVKENPREIILINLIDCAKLAQISQSFQFELNPNNLYYNIHNQVFVMDRDVYARGKGFNEEKFINQYKSLIGFALQKKYTYEDYVKGGLELLNKDKFLTKIASMDNIDDIQECLRIEYQEVIVKNQMTKVYVSKKKTKRNKILLLVSSALLAISLVIIGIQMFYIRPYQNSVIGANNCYLKLDYTGVIQSFSNTKLKRMNVYDQYILAYSYIQCESLTGEQKENIMNALSLDTNRKVLEYWIYLGRLNVKKAEDIAQQISDDDLLLYAYLKDKKMIEDNTTISGAEKEQELKRINSEIDKLSDTYKQSDDEKDTDDASSTSELTEDPVSPEPSTTSDLNKIDVIK